MKVKIRQRREVAKGKIYLEFDALNQEINFQAGQFFSLTLINPPYADARGNSRYFGFTNSPTDKTLAMVTRFGVSSFKKSLFEIPLGTEVEIGSIGGTTVLPKDVNTPFILFAGDIGIAPFMSIIRFVQEKSLSYKITLAYAIKDLESAAFYKELTDFSRENSFFKFIPTNSAIDINFVRNNFQNKNDHYYVLGEKSFVLPTFQALKNFGILPQNISMEIFTGY